MPVVLAGLAAGEAAAGAWPREPGGGFVSLGYELTTTRHALSAEGQAEDPAPDFFGYATLYAEYGLTERLTAGLDIGGDEAWITARVNRGVEGQVAAAGIPEADIAAGDATEREVRTWSGVGFLRYAVGPLDARHRVAVQLGLGQRSYEQQGLFFGLEEMRRETILRPALAYGYGFGGEGLSGWLSVEGSVEFRQDTGGQVVKLDTTLGVRPAEGRLAYMLQVQTGDFPDAAPYAKLVPAVLVDVGRGVTLETGAIYGVSGDDSVGARVGLWFEW